MKHDVGKAVPMLGVPDVQAAIAFWRDQLGFEVMGTYDDEGGKACWAYLRQADTPIMLNLEEEGLDAARGSTLYFYPEDVAALHASFKGQGLEVSDLEDTFYGMKEFELIAPGGHALWFGQDSGDNDNDDNA
ncbi:MAG: VOC family protein [Planctomycetes bacterium]|nr:VOC family protein [Planctomycetota bacterium]